MTTTTPDPMREAIAHKLMEFDGHRSWELSEREQQIYSKRADKILALAAPQRDAPAPTDPATAAPGQSLRLVDRLTDVVMMLDTPDAYNREYIAAVCRSILSSVVSSIVNEDLSECGDANCGCTVGLSCPKASSVPSTSRGAQPCDPNDLRPIWEQGLALPSKDRGAE